MAQRTIHALFARLLAERVDIRDKERFLAGSLLPDAYAEPADRKRAHFIRHTADDKGRYFAFDSFCESYHDRIVADDLYLGYYAHLVEDAFYRYFIYIEQDLTSKLASHKPDVLHGDYAILNTYIARSYAMPSHLRVPDNLQCEEINAIATFDLPKALSDYQTDIETVVSGQPVLLTAEMLKAFVDKYTDRLAQELTAIRNGRGSTLNALDYQFTKF